MGAGGIPPPPFPHHQKIGKHIFQANIMQNSGTSLIFRTYIYGQKCLAASSWLSSYAYDEHCVNSYRNCQCCRPTYWARWNHAVHQCTEAWNDKLILDRRQSTTGFTLFYRQKIQDFSRTPKNNLPGPVRSLQMFKYKEKKQHLLTIFTEYSIAENSAWSKMWTLAIQNSDELIYIWSLYAVIVEAVLKVFHSSRSLIHYRNAWL